MTLDPCQACEGISVSERVEPFVVERAEGSVTIQDRRMVCASCGNVSYRGSQVSEHELAVAAAIRQIEGLLSAEELCNIRTKYGLRQTDMEQILSTGAKTWTRWERGKVTQSKIADGYIRSLAEDPYQMQRAMRKAKVVNPEAEAVFAQIEREDRRRAHAILREELARHTELDRDGIAALAADTAFDAVRRGQHEAREAA